MADYINFLSVALQINMVSCYELKRVGTGSVGSEEKGDAQTADSFPFLLNMLVMRFFFYSIAIKMENKNTVACAFVPFSPIHVDPSRPHERTRI